MLKPRPGSTRLYSPRRSYSPRKSARKDTGQAVKPRPTSKAKKRSSRGREKSDKTPSKKQDEKKGESSYDLAIDYSEAKPSFRTAWFQGAFSLLSLSMIQNVGLCAASAIDVAFRPIAGRIKHCLDSWHKITCSNWVLKVVSEGYRLQFSGKRPKLPYRVKNLPTSGEGDTVLDIEVQQMLLKKAIHAVESSENEIVSCFFARPKKQSGKWRPIVSLKYLNKFLRYTKFRMTTIKDVKSWIRKDYFFTSIDLTDAYFSIPLHPSAWNLIRFK